MGRSSSEELNYPKSCPFFHVSRCRSDEAHVIMQLFSDFRGSIVLRSLHASVHFSALPIFSVFSALSTFHPFSAGNMGAKTDDKYCFLCEKCKAIDLTNLL
jgi:hypothetical protein